jgi:hypothetical protein
LVSNHILEIFALCELSVESIGIIVTDGRERNSAAKIGNNNILWIWCCIHLLLLAFYDFLMYFHKILKKTKQIGL